MAYARCRSNRSTPGVDRKDFAEVEAYEAQKWLSELALALSKKCYQPDPIDTVGEYRKREFKHTKRRIV